MLRAPCMGVGAPSAGPPRPPPPHAAAYHPSPSPSPYPPHPPLGSRLRLYSYFTPTAVYTTSAVYTTTSFLQTRVCSRTRTMTAPSQDSIAWRRGQLMGVGLVPRGPLPVARGRETGQDMHSHTWHAHRPRYSRSVCRDGGRGKGEETLCRTVDPAVRHRALCRTSLVITGRDSQGQISVS